MVQLEFCMIIYFYLKENHQKLIELNVAHIFFGGGGGSDECGLLDVGKFDDVNPTFKDCFEQHQKVRV